MPRAGRGAFLLAGKAALTSNNHGGLQTSVPPLDMDPKTRSRQWTLATDRALLRKVLMPLLRRRHSPNQMACLPVQKEPAGGRIRSLATRGTFGQDRSQPSAPGIDQGWGHRHCAVVGEHFHKARVRPAHVPDRRSGHAKFNVLCICAAGICVAPLDGDQSSRNTAFLGKLLFR